MVKNFDAFVCVWIHVRYVPVNRLARQPSEMTRKYVESAMIVNCWLMPFIDFCAIVFVTAPFVYILSIGLTGTFQICFPSMTSVSFFTVVLHDGCLVPVGGEYRSRIPF